MAGPLSATELQGKDAGKVTGQEQEPPAKETCGCFVFTHQSAQIMIENLDSWIWEKFNLLDKSELNTLIKARCKLFVQATNGIHSILSVRDSTNAGSKVKLPQRCYTNL